MSKELQKRVERLFLPLQPIISRKNELIRAGDIVFMQYQRGRVEAVTADGRRYELPDNINYYETLFKGLFLRVHRSNLVAVERIEGTFERFPAETEERADLRGKEDECELALRGSDVRVPVTSTYGKAVKKALGVSSFQNLVPEHPADKKLRQHGLIDFGWREL
jgi:hypothetical protein